MADSPPGPIADRAFETGFKLATVGGVVGVVLLYWSGVLSLSDGTHFMYTLVMFPVYLVAAATLLGVWLGYDTDASNLERVRRDPDPDAREGSR